MDSDAPSRKAVVLCTCPDRASALRIAEALVGARLAACVNVVENVTSVYEWQGAMQKDAEFLLLIKTPAALFDRVQALVESMHPYELPELISVAVDGGSQRYLAWIDACVGTPT